MIVSPSIGTDLIHFGATECEATKKLGLPDKVYMNDIHSSRLQYNQLKLELSFDAVNNHQLGRIEVHNANAILFGRKLIGSNEKEVLDFVGKHISEQPEFTDYGSFLTFIYKENKLELKFQFGRLESINLNVQQDKSDKPLWPSNA